MDSLDSVMREIRVAIIGAGELGKQALHYISQDSLINSKYSVVGWIDDTCEKGKMIADIPVIGETREILQLYQRGSFDACFVAIGYNHLDFKLKLLTSLRGSIPMINILSPNTYIDESAVLGENVFLYPGVIVDKHVKINDGCVLNLGVIVSHDSQVGECSFLAPNSVIAGFSKIGKLSFMGISSGIIDNISVCDNVKLGAGSIVTKSISQPGLYCGIPEQ